MKPFFVNIARDLYSDGYSIFIYRRVGPDSKIARIKITWEEVDPSISRAPTCKLTIDQLVAFYRSLVDVGIIPEAKEETLKAMEAHIETLKHVVDRTFDIADREIKHETR